MTEEMEKEYERLVRELERLLQIEAEIKKKLIIIRENENNPHLQQR